METNPNTSEYPKAFATAGPIHALAVSREMPEIMRINLKSGAPSNTNKTTYHG